LVFVVRAVGTLARERYALLTVPLEDDRSLSKAITHESGDRLKMHLFESEVWHPKG